MIKHPLDGVFNLDDSMSTEEVDIERDYELAEVQPTPINPEPVPDIKDEDDLLVEQRIDEVYSAAIEAFQSMTAYTEVIEPRYAARNAEVSATFLSLALQAAGTRAKVKTDRKKANAPAFIPHGNKSTTNVLVASREEIMKMITIDSTEKKV